MFSTRLLCVLLGSFSALHVSAQRPGNTSICDYYTIAYLREATAANQLTFVTWLVNTIIAGNYTIASTGTVISSDTLVPGVLTTGTVNGSSVNLVPYFDGSLVSTNRDGRAVAINFLDDGGTGAIFDNLPARGTTSNQYRLMNHLYQYFGLMLGCSSYGKGFPTYAGVTSMYESHKYMALGNAQVTYFIQQTLLAMQSLGVENADTNAIGTLLTTAFDQRCAANLTTVPSVGPQQQAICIADDCKIASGGSNCSAYPAVVRPFAANSNSLDSSSTATGSPSSSATIAGSSSPGTNNSASSGLSDGAKIGIGVGIGIGGFLLIVAVGAFFIGRYLGQKRQSSNVSSNHQPSGAGEKEPGVGVVYYAEPGVALDDQTEGQFVR